GEPGGGAEPRSGAARRGRPGADDRGQAAPARRAVLGPRRPGDRGARRHPPGGAGRAGDRGAARGARRRVRAELLGPALGARLRPPDRDRSHGRGPGRRQRAARLPRGDGVTSAGASSGPLLELRDVSAGYGPFRAIFDVSLEIPEGKVLALLGSNGAGTTT